MAQSLIEFMKGELDRLFARKTIEDADVNDFRNNVNEKIQVHGGNTIFQKTVSISIPLTSTPVPCKVKSLTTVMDSLLGARVKEVGISCGEVRRTIIEECICPPVTPLKDPPRVQASIFKGHDFSRKEMDKVIINNPTIIGPKLIPYFDEVEMTITSIERTAFTN